MKTNARICWAAWVLCAACLAKGESLSLTNTTSVPPSNPALAVGIDLPKFDPGLGTLQDVRLTSSGSLISLFKWDEPAGAALTLWQTNALLLVYGGSDVLASRTAVFTSVGYPAPVNGFGQEMWGAPLARKSFTLSLPGDLANFTGSGTVPISAAYYNFAVVTPFGGSGTWSLDNRATVTVELTYDFAMVPEPEVVWLFGALGLAAVAGQQSRKRLTDRR